MLQLLWWILRKYESKKKYESKIIKKGSIIKVLLRYESKKNDQNLNRYMCQVDTCVTK